MDENLQALNKMYEMMDTKSTIQEMLVVFQTMLDLVKEILSKNQTERIDIQNNVNNTVEQTLNKTIEKLQSFNVTEWDKIQQRVDSIKDGENYLLTEKDKRDIASTIDVPIVEKITTETIREVSLKDTPEQLRDKLETLNDDARLDASAIKGLERGNVKLTDDIINRAIGIVDQRTSFLINKVSNLKDQVDRISTTGGGHTIEDEGIPLTQRTSLNFVGAGVSVADSGGKTVVTIGGGSTTFVENEVVGTGDDSTTVFSLANTPIAGSVHVFVGMRQTLTDDYSISGTTITFVVAPPTGQKIIADYRM